MSNNTTEGDTPSSFAARIKWVLRNRDLTQTALAEILDCSQSYISDLARGRKRISESMASKMQQKLDVSRKWLLWGEGYPNVKRLRGQGEHGIAETTTTTPYPIYGEDLSLQDDLSEIVKPKIHVCGDRQSRREFDESSYDLLPVVPSSEYLTQTRIPHSAIQDYVPVPHHVSTGPIRCRCLRVLSDDLAPWIPFGTLLAIDTRVTESGESWDGKLVCLQNTGHDDILFRLIKIGELQGTNTDTRVAFAWKNTGIGPQRGSFTAMELGKLQERCIGVVVWAQLDLRHTTEYPCPPPYILHSPAAQFCPQALTYVVARIVARLLSNVTRYLFCWLLKWPF